jgi:hypothetical protein
MPLPQGLGGVVPTSMPPAPVSVARVISAGDRGRMERWQRMDVLYQSIRDNANQFDYPAPSVAALESVLVRMYFESPISAPQHPQPAYPTSNLQLAELGHPQQPENVVADHADSTTSGSDDE